MSKSLFVFSVLFTVTLASAGEWTTLHEGIEFQKLEKTEPLQKVDVLRIDTKVESLTFYTTGRNKDYKPEESETERSTTLQFLNDNNLLAAVNANFYNPFNSQTVVRKGPSNVIGLAISEGEIVSESSEKFPAFLVSSNGVCSIKVVYPKDDTKGIRTAVAGNMIVLKNGEVIKQNDKNVHPRTAVGISKDGRYVYLLTVDGRQKGFSIGATYEEVGNLLLEVGAYEGLNLDGGGSTTMVVREKDGMAKVLNHPVGHGGKSGALRYNANHLGVRSCKQIK